MEEKVFDIEMMYIYNTSGKNYTIECNSRYHKNTKLNFSEVEGVELIAKVPIEIKSSFMQLAENTSRSWNLRFAFPLNMRIRYAGKIEIESM